MFQPKGRGALNRLRLRRICVGGLADGSTVSGGHEMGGLDWRRAQPKKPTEDAIGEGFVRKDGRVTPTIRKDQLAKRAARAEGAWLEATGLGDAFPAKPGNKHQAAKPASKARRIDPNSAEGRRILAALRSR